ncbi:transmembrane channel-like protein 8 [Ornithorhynchus anatinus]|uniref:transmembrane channel-like protein 8 n=1 Tax=Ornithorhynchus anatinus TaxID=9258 RepID=UPI0010A90D82|nr:transmembrane channel-like protein 8 [Ornithorhynchus anatinus]
MATPLRRRKDSRADVSEELWEEELERLRKTQGPLRELPYSMMDKRLIRQLRKPEEDHEDCWESWWRRQRVVLRRLHDSARRVRASCGLWEGSLYKIGGLFGTGIQSYFTFLRFLLYLNLLTLLLTITTTLLPLVWLQPLDRGPPPITDPKCLISSQNHTSQGDIFSSSAFQNTWLFYGWYKAGPESSYSYSVRLAYLLGPLAGLLLCFGWTLNRMVRGLLGKQLLSQKYRPLFSTKVFDAWDFCIQSRASANIKQRVISNEFKLELGEELRYQQMRQQTRKQKARRFLSYLWPNAVIGALVALAIFFIYYATKASQASKKDDEQCSLHSVRCVVLQYLPLGVIALVNFLGPQVFPVLVRQVDCSPNTEINLTLIWFVVLKLSSLGMFFFSMGQTVLCVGQTNRSECEPCGYNDHYQCWENAIAQEMYKLCIFNFLLTVAFTFLVSLPRRLLVERFSGPLWVWLGREEFTVSKNVLDLMAGQTVTWMGLFYGPLLPLLNGGFIFLTFYIKKYNLLCNCRAPERHIQASRSTSFFQLVLLLGLFLAIMPLGYVVSSVPSSRACGLFANYSAPWEVVPEAVETRLPAEAQLVLNYMGSNAFCYPFLFLLSLALTVGVSQSRANTRTIQVLRKQLVWQVREKWHLVGDLNRLLEAAGGMESPFSQRPRRGSFCPGFPCPGSPGPRSPGPGSSRLLSSKSLSSSLAFFPCPEPLPVPLSPHSPFTFPSSPDLRIS